jgi:catalase-peroxidase
MISSLIFSIYDTTWKSVSESDTILKVIIVLRRVERYWYSRRFDIRLEFRAVLQKCMDADSSEKFVNDFVKAWDKVIDRFDLVK